MPDDGGHSKGVPVKTAVANAMCQSLYKGMRRKKTAVNRRPLMVIVQLNQDFVLIDVAPCVRLFWFVIK